MLSDTGSVFDSATILRVSDSPEPSRHILFVSTDKRLLDGFRDLFRRHRHAWQMTFENSSESALLVLQQLSIDFVVTVLGGPDQDELDLLSWVKANRPGAVRIALTAKTDGEIGLAAVPLAQRFVTLPCEPRELESLISRACSLRDLTQSEAIRRVVGKLDRLPSLPTVYQEITKILGSNNFNFRDLACVLERDVALSAKILQVVNSGYFRMPKRIADVSRAVSYLGSETVRSVVLTQSAFADFGKKNGQIADLCKRAQADGLKVACLASRIIGDRELSADVFTAGMLHDIGKLVLAVGMPVELHAAQQLEARGVPDFRAEKACCGASHPHVGGYLLSVWSLPEPVIEAVAAHHDPKSMGVRNFGVAAAVHIAHELVTHDGREDSPPHLDEFVESVGMTHKLDAWKQLARAQARDADEQDTLV